MRLPAPSPISLSSFCHPFLQYPLPSSSQSPWILCASLLQDPIYIPLHQLCGLHQKRKCLYGQDCKSIHICRDLWGSFLQNHTWLQQAVKNQRHLTGAGSGPGRGRGKGKGWLRNRSVKLKADPDEASPSSGSVEKAEKTVRLKEELDEDRPEKLQPTPKPSRARRLSLRFRSEPEVKEIS